MNHELIAEYLANTKSPVQLVKHLDEVIDKHKIYPMGIQVKHDGIYTLVVVVDGVVKLYGRTGLALYWEAANILREENLRDSPMPDPHLKDGVYIGEYCNPMYTLEQLSGFLNPNRKKVWDDVDSALINDSTIHMHDYLTFDELLGGYSDRSYTERHKLLSKRMFQAGLSAWVIPYQLVYSETAAQEFTDKVIANCGEGSVIKRLDVGWIAGHKGFNAMKLVRGISLDLLCTGVFFGKGKREGQIAALEFEYKGNKFKADLGKGWTDERRAALTLAFTEYRTGHTCSVTECKTGEVFKNPVGHIWEVKALDISSTGKALRLPKVQRVRWDKDVPDGEITEHIYV